MTSRSLLFAWTPWSLALSIAIFAVGAALCFAAWRRGGYGRSHGVLELLRLALLAMVALLLNQPEWVEQIRPDEKPTIAVLWDDSRSMDTRDAPGEGSLRVSRREAIARLAQSAFWKPLEDRLTVVTQPFAAATSEGGTDLGQPLAEAPARHKWLRGVVLASDGDWNEGSPPVLAAAALGLKDIPVFAVPVGSASRLPDVELCGLDPPTFGVAGKSVRVPFSIESTLPGERVATVTLKTSDGDSLTKEVRIAAMGRTNDSIVWKPKTSGDFTLTLDVPKQADEALADNNSLSAPIAIRSERLGVLVVESVPRWEYRYLRNALSRDPGVELSCLLFHPDLPKAGGGNKDYIKQFPQGLEELSQFDVIFLGDVGVEPGQLTVEDCRLLRGVVERQASGLVFMPGWQGRELSLVDTPLGELIPVVFDPSQPGGWGSRTASHFELTELGRRSLLTKLADTEDENAEIWESLPGFQWHAPVLRAKAGADVLCVHQEMSNEFGRIPLLATRSFGAGKLLFMGTDGAWRWRKGVEDKYHYRFWGQVVRWMAYQRNMAKGETMRLYYSPDQPQVRQTLTLNANVMEPSGEPLSTGDVAARIVAPSGKVQMVHFASAGDEWGAFSARFTPEEAGQHQLTLSCKQTGATLAATLFARGAAVERVGRAARAEVMEEIARVSGGRVIAVDHLEQAVAALAALPDAPPVTRRMRLWSDPIVAGILVGLLGVFWVGRKAIGLI